MNEQDNSAENIGEYVEPKEGERVLLSCNTADIRSPSLGFNPNSQSKETALDYLASVLVEAYFDHKDNERNRKESTQTGSDLLQGIN